MNKDEFDSATDLEIAELLAECFYQQKDYRRCLQVSKPYVINESQSFELMLLAGKSAFQLKRWNECVGALNLCLESEKLMGDDLVLLVNTLGKANRNDEISAVLIKAGQIEPKSESLTSAIRKLQRAYQ